MTSEELGLAPGPAPGPAPGSAPGPAPATPGFRESLKRLYASERFQVSPRGAEGQERTCVFSCPPLSSWCLQVAVVCLVVLDAFFVLAELLIDLSIIKLEHGHVAPQVRRRCT